MITLTRPYAPFYITGFLNNIRDMTSSFDGIEILVKVDSDDPATLAAVNIHKDLPIKIAIMDGKYKKTGIAFYANELALMATGQILWGCSDLMRINTVGWDNDLRRYLTPEYLDKPRNFHTAFPGGGREFPMINRRWYEEAGLFCGHAFADSWINTLNDRIGFPTHTHIPEIEIRKQPAVAASYLTGIYTPKKAHDRSTFSLESIEVQNEINAIAERIRDCYKVLGATLNK